MNCHYCNQSFENDDLRPYGPNREFVCFPCAMKPENAQTTTAVAMNAMQEASDASENGSIIIGEHTGPRPMIPRSLV